MAEKLTARYYTADGKAGKAFTLPGVRFDGAVHEASIYAVVTGFLANRRQGTASAKNRSAVRGGGRKPWRQKGTGRARHGSIRSPIWRGGGVIFPPTARSYRQKLPKKVRHLARRSAFNARANEDRVIVVEAFEFEQPKTRKLYGLLQKLEVADQKVLILTAGHRPIVHLSGRNIPGLEVRPYGMESAYEVLWADFVIIEEPALREPGPAARSTPAEEAVEESEGAEEDVEEVTGEAEEAADA